MTKILLLMFSVLFMQARVNSEGYSMAPQVLHCNGNDTNSSCIAHVFVDTEYDEDIDIFDQPNGLKIDSIRNDVFRGVFILLSLLKQDGNMFYIKAYSSLDEDKCIAEGWINRNNHLGIYSSVYTGGLVLYKYPCNANVLIVKTEYDPEMYEVIDFDCQWLKIRMKIDGETYSGWISPEQQCCNVYSTCS